MCFGCDILFVCVLYCFFFIKNACILTHHGNRFQIGLFQRIFGNRINIFNRNNNNNNENNDNSNENEDNNDSNMIRITLKLNYSQLLQRFIIGIIISLWPTWENTAFFPRPQTILQPINNDNNQ